MALFSNADEKEIEKRKEEQDRREVELDRRQADVSHREQVHRESVEALRNQRDAETGSLQAAQKDVAAREQALFEREQTISQREIAAAAGFVEQQRETFRQAIESRVGALDQRQKDLDALEERLSRDLETLSKRQGELTSREMAVLERELKADAGFADKLCVLRDEIEARERACAEQERILREREAAVQAENGRLEHRREELRQREERILKSEQERDAGYAELRRQVDQELHQKRITAEEEGARIRVERISAIEKEMTETRHTRLAEISEAETVECDRIKCLIAAERTRQSEETKKTLERLQAERNELEKGRGEMDAAKDEVTYRETLVAAKDDALNRRIGAIDEEVSKLVAERQQSFESSERGLKQENSRLRESLAKTAALLNCFEELKLRLGDEPEKVLLQLNSKTDELKVIREELATRPSQELRERFDNQQAELERLKARLTEMEGVASEHRQRLAGENELRAKFGEAETNNKALRNRAEILDGECSRLSEELKRMRAAYEREEDREARVRDIKVAHIKVAPSTRSQEGIDEMKWLDGISQQCIDYGIRFHPRILRAFHTALKTAEWSPLTVLAGVSGTGKSELPRLYAHFGGMPFLPLSVQPNWDSQEAMLGFFNSIDNKFDAQPVLRFLAQSQEKNEQSYPGLQDAVCMILLDEMNLAHAELYFAEFLSKLELRRGLKGENIPFIDVKLGAGLESFKLRLGRNVLWTGTMNQDETTKSLSDKVLDRSIVIHFPRPVSLERRRKLKSLPAAGDLLPRKVWESWWSKESDFSDEEVQPFKGFIEDMNAALSQAGRALGHRVWQSIEYYMANYPDVQVARKSGDAQQLKQAMRMAFEDQLVQKVMPKLRGIETRGRSKSECLDKIRAQIVEHNYQIVEDFDLACEFGYGQFIWQSANYLRDADADSGTPEERSAVPTETVVNEESSGSGPDEQSDLSHPPDQFKRGEPDRQRAWDELGLKQKKMWKQKRPN